MSQANYLTPSHQAVTELPRHLKCPGEIPARCPEITGIFHEDPRYLLGTFPFAGYIWAGSMEDAGVKIESQRSVTLDLPPSCLEFSPLLPSYFLVGTYNLQNTDEEPGDDESSSTSAPQKRDGSIVIYEVAGQELVNIHTESRPSAILDLRFQPCPGKEDIVGVVSSTGTLEIFRFSASLSGPPSLTLLSTLRLPSVGADVLFLQFAWHPTIPDTAAVTTSQGGVHILQLGSDYKAVRTPEDALILHSLEAWCVAMSPSDPTLEQSNSLSFTLYSGGDDSLLQYTTCVVKSTNTPPEGDRSFEPELPYTAAVVRGHDAGVTAILPLPCGSNVVVTGSYDDHIRIYSIQPLQETYGIRKASLLVEANLGGGVWRLRLVRVDFTQGEPGTWTATVLASCMHAGARVVEIRGFDDPSDDIKVEIIGRFEEHKSMNYASDFMPGSEVDNQKGLQCVSTSFYDRLLCLWSFKLPC